MQMQYKHYKGVRLALTSGHTANVGTEWKPLHERFHAEALAQGCQCDQGIIPEPPVIVPKASPQAMANTDETTVLREALIRMIARDAPGDDFTNGGKPNLNVLRREAGIAFDKDVAYRIFEELKAEAGAGDATGGDGAGDGAGAGAGQGGKE